MRQRAEEVTVKSRALLEEDDGTVVVVRMWLDTSEVLVVADTTQQRPTGDMWVRE